MSRVVIVDALRTAIGAFGGSLKDISSVEMGEHLIRHLLEKHKLSGDDIDEVIFGNVLSAGKGQNIARQISVNAGIPESVPAYTVNKVCGSGLKTVALGAQSILAGDNQIVIAGGTENMSQAAFVSEEPRFGKKLGHFQLKDTLLSDGLTDAFDDIHMGITAENINEKYGISREDQDEFAVNSQLKAEEAIKAGKFKNEIVPIEIKQRRETKVFDTDEHPRFGATAEKFKKLRPAFKKDGSVTAGNSSGINDGAAVVLLMSEEKAQELGLEILGIIKGYASAGIDHKIMGCGPIPSSKKVLDKVGLSVEDLDLVEANEAFAAQSIAVLQELGLDSEKVNVNGGAIALGHPIGASGTRILVTLLHEMNRRDSKYGLATLCIGGGMGIAMIIER